MKHIQIFLLAVSLLFGATAYAQSSVQVVVQLTNGTTLSFNADEFRYMRRLGATGATIYTYSAGNFNNYPTTTTYDAIISAACGNLVTIQTIVNGTQIDQAFNQKWVDRVEALPNGNAKVFMKQTGTAFNTTQPFATVQTLLANCVSGGGGGSTTITAGNPQITVTGPVGGPYTISNSGDLSAANEIQTLSVPSADNLSLSLGGGTVTVDTDPANDIKIGDPAGGDLTGTFPNPTIGTGAVTTSKIATNAVDSSKVATGAITGRTIRDGAITNVDIANATITGAKIAQQGASLNQSLAWSGSTWAPANIGGVSGISNDTSSSIPPTGFPISTVNSKTILARLSGLPAGTVQMQVRPLSIDSSFIATGAITGRTILNGAITNVDIANGTITGSKIAQQGATPGQALAWNGSNWVPTTVGGGGGSSAPDSTWVNATTNSYQNKRITQKAYRFGQTILGSRRTARSPAYQSVYSYVPDSVRLIVNTNSGNDAPAIFVTGTGGKSTMSPLMWALDSTLYPDAMPSGLFTSYFPNVSSAGNNTTMGLGLNIGNNSGRLVTGKPSAYLQFEQNFAANTSTGDLEFHVDFVPTTLGGYRPLYFTAGNTNGDNSVGLIAAKQIVFTEGGIDGSGTKGVWAASGLTLTSPNANGGVALNIQPDGNGTPVLRMRKPSNSGTGAGALFDVMFINNISGLAKLQLSNSTPTLFNGQSFSAGGQSLCFFSDFTISGIDTTYVGMMPNYNQSAGAYKENRPNVLTIIGRTNAQKNSINLYSSSITNTANSAWGMGLTEESGTTSDFVLWSKTGINTQTPEFSVKRQSGSNQRNGRVGVNLKPSELVYEFEVGGPGAMRVPIGNTSQEPTGARGTFRLNTQTRKYRGVRNGTTWEDFLTRQDTLGATTVNQPLVWTGSQWSPGTQVTVPVSNGYSLVTNNTGGGAAGLGFQNNGVVKAEILYTPNGSNTNVDFDAQRQGGGVDSWLNYNGATDKVTINPSGGGALRVSPLTEAPYTTVSAAGALPATHTRQYISLSSSGTVTIPTTFADGTLLMLYNESSSATVTVSAGAGESLKTAVSLAVDARVTLQKKGSAWYTWSN